MSYDINDSSKSYHVPTERRIELCDAEVTLDGKRAVIRGWRNDFATVRQLPDGKLHAEFAWKTVEHVIEHSNGEFKA